MKIEKLTPFGVRVTADHPTLVSTLEIGMIEGLIHEHKMVVLRGFQSLARDEFLSFCKNVPGMKTLNWSFGPVMEMKESQDPLNYLFSREHVPFHWDGAFHQVPDYLVFACVEAPVAEAGGETLFTNTEMIVAQASEQEKKQWAAASMKYETEKLAHYGGSICGPLLQNHPESGQPILRFAEPVNTKMNPVTLEVIGLPKPDSDVLVQDLTAKIYADNFCYRHEWQQGDFLIADNHSLIHGRTAFKQNCPRHLRRIQLIKERA